MRDVYLSGGAMSELTKLKSQDSFDLVRETMAAALADAGLPRDCVEGLAITPPGMASHPTVMFVSRLGAHLGMNLKSLTCLENGGCSSALALRWAIYEVQSGRCDVAVAVGIDQRYPSTPERGEELTSFLDRTVIRQVSLYGAWDGPYGLGAPIPYYGMSAQRYLYETGATREDMAWAAVRLREHAHAHPRAVFRDKELSVDDVVNSKVLSPPLHLADCSQFVSGAGAVVVTSADVARATGRTCARLRGWGQHHHPSSFTASAESLTTFPAVRKAAAEAYADAGCGPSDLDVAEIYGVFSSTELMLCEDLGFFDRGRAGGAFKEGRTTHGGDLVIDPTGGRLSLGHPAAATPILSTVEVLHQLAGRADGRQVDGARLGLVHAEHGMLNGSIVTIWERGDA